jgi:dUTPase
MAAVDNIKDKSHVLEPGQRLFQLVSMDGGPISFELIDELTGSERGAGGFGSTGK